MKEIQYLNLIKKALSDPSYLGDDCAFLSDLGIYVTHDSLVENVHFSLSTTSAYDLGYKSAAVNLSDLAASGAEAKYITISLSLPERLGDDFVSEFYRGINDICNKYNVKVIGGDLTGADKVFISICAIGKEVFDAKVSRSHAKTGDMVFVTGFHGDSAGGLKLLCLKKTEPISLISAHIKPEPQLVKSEKIMNAVSSDFAMMDTSDGLADALFKIAKASGVTIEAKFGNVPVSDELKSTFPDSWRELVLWGGEDFQLVTCLRESEFSKLDKNEFFEIGRVTDKIENMPVIIKDGERLTIIDEEAFNNKSFKHFEDEK